MAYRDVKNATALPKLSASRLLQTVEDRFDVEEVYTWVGTMLLAVNPYRFLPVYDSESAVRHFQSTIHHADPHPFALAAHAYRCMVAERISQSLVISGESGSGKTETAKICLKFLTEISKSSEFRAFDGHRVVLTSPVLEAFGCAQTALNGNSSRFGKTVKLKFDETGTGKHASLVSAEIETYLLARSRVTQVPQGERNYHIFYLLADGLSQDHALRQQLCLGNFASSDFHYTSTQATAAHMGDENFMRQVLEAFEALGVAAERQLEIFRGVAAVLWLGNIEVEPTVGNPAGACKISDQSVAALHTCASLLGVEARDLEISITKLTMAVGKAKEPMLADAPAAKARMFRDALARSLFSRVFDFLVSTLNACLSSAGGAHSGSPEISIIDIFGLEKFPINGFEQLCINHANEKLHSFFLQSVAEAEISEHAREHVAYCEPPRPRDNSAVVQGVERGVVAPLRRATLDAALRPLEAVDYEQEFFEKVVAMAGVVKKDKKRRKFVVSHFAADVEYSVGNFVDANKHSDHKVDAFLSKIWTSSDTPSSRECSLASRKCLATEFVTQVDQLMDNLRATHGHWIRCIRPNAFSRPGNFDSRLVHQQLQVSGMFEVLGLMAACYTSRVPYAEIFRNFNAGGSRATPVFAREFLSLLSDSSAVAELGLHTSLALNLVALGLSKVFLKPGAMAVLEGVFAECASDSVLTWRISDAVHRRITVQRRRRMQLFLRLCGRFVALLRRSRATRKWFFLFFLRLAALVKFVRVRLLPRVLQKRREREAQAARLVVAAARSFAVSLRLSIARTRSDPAQEKLLMLESEFAALQAANARLQGEVAEHRLQEVESKRRLVVLESAFAEAQSQLSIALQTGLREAERHEAEKTVLLAKLQEALTARSFVEQEAVRSQLARHESRVKENDARMRPIENDMDERSGGKIKYLEWLKSQTPSKSRNNE